MKNKTLIYILLFSLFSSISFAAVDRSDPKNRPRDIGGECYSSHNAKKAKLNLDLTIGRNPVTGNVTSRAELAGGDKATNNLEAAQQNFGKKKVELEEAEELYAGDPSVKNSRRVDKARKAFKQAQIDLAATEEIKEKADRRKAEK